MFTVKFNLMDVLDFLMAFTVFVFAGVPMLVFIKKSLQGEGLEETEQDQKQD